MRQKRNHDDDPPRSSGGSQDKEQISGAEKRAYKISCAWGLPEAPAASVLPSKYAPEAAASGLPEAAAASGLPEAAAASVLPEAAAASGLPEAAAASVLPEAAPEAAASGSGPHEAAADSAGADNDQEMEWDSMELLYSIIEDSKEKDSDSSKLVNRAKRAYKVWEELGQPQSRAERYKRSNAPKLDELPSWEIPPGEMIHEKGWRYQYDVSNLPRLKTGAKLFITRDYFILNEDGKRVDEHGRHWIPRGLPSRHRKSKMRPDKWKWVPTRRPKWVPKVDGASKGFTYRSFDSAGAASPRRPQCSTETAP